MPGRQVRRGPLLLAVDTSAYAASAAVVVPGACLGQVGLRTRRPSGNLLPAIEDLLCGLDLEAGRLDAFAVTVGPGSFTGVRVGMAAVQAMARALERPVVGIGTLDAVAATGRHLRPPLAVLRDARRGNVYAAAYTVAAGRPLRTTEIADADPAAWLAELAWPVTILGDGLEVHPEAWASAPAGSRRAFGSPFLAAEAGALALERVMHGETAAPGDLRPLYVRPPDARLPEPSADG